MYINYGRTVKWGSLFALNLKIILHVLIHIPSDYTEEGTASVKLSVSRIVLRHLRGI